MALGTLLLVLLGPGRSDALRVGWLIPLPENNGPTETPGEPSAPTGVHDEVEDLLTHSARCVLVPATGRRQRVRITHTRIPHRADLVPAWRGHLTPLRC